MDSQTFHGFGSGMNSKLTPFLPSMSTVLPPESETIPTLPITPPATESDPHAEQILSTAAHVLSTEATALSYLSRLYATDPIARGGFVRAVEAIAESFGKGGKTVVIGVGKSGKIGEKMVASMNSLGLLANFLHPVEALHGDLGIVRPNDVLLLITFSGNTPELFSLLPHLPAHLPLIALTSHTSYHTSKLTRERSNAILLPAPIPESEESSFGISAPTTSTTVALALGDALAVAAARCVHKGEGNQPRDVFKRNHPGGAIGLGMGKGVLRISDLAVRLEDIPIVGGDSSSEQEIASPPPSSASSESDLEITEWPSEAAPSTKIPVRVLDCLLLAVRSKKGWLRTPRNEVIPPRRLQRVRDAHSDIYSPNLDLVVPHADMYKISGDASIEEVRKWVVASRAEQELPKGAVFGVVVGGDLVAVLEVDSLFENRTH
ncbi:hypothetical protein RUND412_006590 [Rhizina undulata]